MIDFHSHILPGIDDGSPDPATSLRMLAEMNRQGIDTVVATSHFYANRRTPEHFLFRRLEAWEALSSRLPSDSPKILLGAEVLYFPGISVAEEVRSLCLEGTPFLLVEPPMMPWTDTMLDEIELCGVNLRCVPVLAHVDRYMRLLRDGTLIDRALRRRLLVQVNASFFLHRGLEQGKIHFLGSDAHDIADRPPNIAWAADVIAAAGLTPALEKLDSRVRRAIMNDERS